MGKKFNWRTLSFEEKFVLKLEQFSSEPTEPKYPDGTQITTVDDYIKFVFSTEGINREKAMNLPAVVRGRNLICNIATLPLVMYDRSNNIVTEPRVASLITQIDPDFIANVVTLSSTVEDLIFDGKAYWMVDLVNSSTLYPTKAHYIAVDKVKETPDGKVWVDGKQVDPNTIIRFDSPNPALMKAMTGIISRSLATAATSEMYARNPMPKLLFSPKGDVDPGTVDELREAVQNFADTAADSPYNYVGAPLDAKPLEFITPADLQLVEIEKNIERGVANFFGLDANDLGLGISNDTYNNGVDRRKARINDVLNPYMQAIEQRLSMGDVTPTGYFVKFSQDDYLRADPKTRMEVYTGFIAAGVMSVDEVRSKEGLPPMTEQQKALVKPQPAPALEARFSADEETAIGFESAEFSHVDAEKRTVTVMAVPYGEKSSLKNGRKFVFMPGSLNYPESISKIKLLRDHDYSQSVGKAISIQSTDKGLEVTFKIAAGPEGDRALAGFTDGTYDHASVGVDFDSDGVTTDRAHPGVYFVRSARLKEVSQVSIPAFENAGLISVTASRQGEDMTENLDGAVAKAPENGAFSSEQLNQLQAMLAGLLPKSESAPVKTADAPAQDIPAREAFKPNTQEKKVAFISEPSLYRFDGTGEREFSADVIRGLKGKDPEALNRVNTFLAEEFANEEITSSDAAVLNPTKDRPDMYVDQLEYDYPIWSTINRGSLDDITAFRFPKFVSATGLVSNHTENQEPTLGTMAFTNQTVTPTALSGKIEITREAWDQGGSPSLSAAIMTQMRRAWYEGLESSAAAFLDAYSLAAGLITTITPGATGLAAYREVTTALVKLKNQRGGYRLRDFLAHEDLYTKLILAEDGDNRPLFPMINPVNANGGATDGLNLTINGLNLKNAWALGASGSVAENSYLLNPEDVAAWATAPQFLEFNIQVKSVYLGIWGYKAFAVQRDEGLRRLTYDPVA